MTLDMSTDPGTATVTVRPERNSIVPPFWQRRERSDSRLSCNSADAHGSPIRLEDHTDENSEQCKALWARSVTIDDYVVVGSGTTPALGAYVVWNITVDTLNVSSPQGSLHIWCTCFHTDIRLTRPQGSPMKIIKRYVWNACTAREGNSRPIVPRLMGVPDTRTLTTCGRSSSRHSRTRWGRCHRCHQRVSSVSHASAAASPHLPVRASSMY